MMNLSKAIQIRKVCICQLVSIYFQPVKFFLSDNGVPQISFASLYPFFYSNCASDLYMTLDL